MTKKVITVLSLFFCILINILIDINITKYVDVLENCFNRSIDIHKYYMLICVIIALISILIYISIYFLIAKREIKDKGLKLKPENGVYGTADLMNDKLFKKTFELDSKNGILIGEKNNKRVTLNSNIHNRNVVVVGPSRLTVKQ